MSKTQAKTITIIGAGYVGLVNAACLAELGHTVRCLDIDAAKVAALRRGEIGIREPGLAEWLHRNSTRGRLTFTADYDEAVPGCAMVMICVDTPVDSEGNPDLRHLMSAVNQLATRHEDSATIVLRSTVPPGTCDVVQRRLQSFNGGRRVAVVAHPEFFQEGRALEDGWNPARVVVGSRDRAAARAVADLWASRGAPSIVTDPLTAEMIKQASNAFLATKISFINDIAGICSRVGADVTEVARGMSFDPRIGASYLSAGLGFGGSCLPKDLRALIGTSRARGWEPQMLTAAIAVNERQRQLVNEILSACLDGVYGRTVAVFGLAFKPGTSDLRDSPAVAVVHNLAGSGAAVRATDPAVSDISRLKLGAGISLHGDAYQAAAGADAAVLTTDWPEFSALDWTRIAGLMNGKLVLDARNALDRADVAAAGLEYVGLGRPGADLPAVADEGSGGAPGGGAQG